MADPVTVEGVLAAVVRTPLVQLRRIVPGGSARILLEIESLHPTGSMAPAGDRPGGGAGRPRDRRRLRRAGGDR